MATIREDEGDARAGTGTQYKLSLNDVFQGTLSPVNDEDWVRVKLTAGTIYDITLTGEDTGRLALFDSAGNHVIYGNYNPSGYRLIYSPAVSGTYYLRVGRSDLDYSGDYELSLIENTIPEGTYDEIVDYLIVGNWEYFDGGGRRAFDVAPGGVLTVDITALTTQGQQLARWALESWTYVTGIEFAFVDDDIVHIRFDDYPVDATGITYIATSDEVIHSSEVVVPLKTLQDYGTSIGSFTLMIYIHEIGHALGLGHSGPYDGRVYYGIDNIFLNDSLQATVMSYFDQEENTYIDASEAFPVTPMIADIIAIHSLYGTPAEVNLGDTVYGYRSNLDGYLGQVFKLWTDEENPFIGINVADPSGKLSLVDLDADGDFDIVMGNGEGTFHYFENTGSTTEPDFRQRTDSNNPLAGLDTGHRSTPEFADLDGDGDYDLVAGSDGGEISYFENTGTVTTPGFTQHTGASNPVDSVEVGDYSIPELADLDGDGDIDLIVGSRDNTPHYFENTGTRTSPNFTHRTGVANPFDGINPGGDSGPALTDIDGDGDLDLILWSWYDNFDYFENTGTVSEPVFTERTGEADLLQPVDDSNYRMPEFIDLDNDNDLDIVFGNHEGTVSYIENTGTHTHPEFTAQTLGPATLTLYDNGGNDTLDLRTDTQDQRVDLRPEGISDVYGLIGNLVTARGTLIENVIAGSGDDQLTGNAVANYLQGRYGNDTLVGGGGDDILEGGAGADRLNGGEGMDWVSYRGSNAAVTVNLVDRTVTGGHADGDVIRGIENAIGSDHGDVLLGNDAPNRLEGRAGADRLDGGGEDWVSYIESDTGVTVNLSGNDVTGGHAEGDVIANFENVTGSGHADVLTGDAGVNQLDGGEGDDVLEGRGGADRLVGGSGEDTASYEHSEAAVTIRLHSGVAQGGDAEGDSFGALVHAGYIDSGGVAQVEDVPDIEHLRGSAHADTLAGDSRDNRLEGGGGDDRLYGGPGGGDDVLRGGPGTDALYGGIGDDVLEGGSDADTLRGGPGADTASY